MPRYPLEPLADLREKKADEATAALGEARRRQEAAARSVRAAEVRSEGHARDAAERRKAELAALARGELHARDLARADAWGVRIAAERAALETAVDSAQRTETRAAEGVEAARDEAAARHTDAKLVEVHRQRWEDENRRRAEAREEEASADAWRPRR
jgi:flagellar biosynthesis chaperone FliJ